MITAAARPDRCRSIGRIVKYEKAIPTMTYRTTRNDVKTKSNRAEPKMTSGVRVGQTSIASSVPVTWPSLNLWAKAVRETDW